MGNTIAQFPSALVHSLTGSPSVRKSWPHLHLFNYILLLSGLIKFCFLFSNPVEHHYFHCSNSSLPLGFGFSLSPFEMPRPASMSVLSGREYSWVAEVLTSSAPGPRFNFQHCERENNKTKKLSAPAQAWATPSNPVTGHLDGHDARLSGSSLRARRALPGFLGLYSPVRDVTYTCMKASSIL